MKILYILLCLLILFIIVPVNVYCQDSTVTNTVQLLDNIRSDIKSGVVSIAEYLKEVSPMVYQATKQKIIIEGWVAAFTCIHLPIFVILWIIAFVKRWGSDASFTFGLCSVISIIITTIVLIIYLPQIFAPDYYTIERLIQFIR